MPGDPICEGAAPGGLIVLWPVVVQLQHRHDEGIVRTPRNLCHTQISLGQFKSACFDSSHWPVKSPQRISGYSLPVSAMYCDLNSPTWLFSCARSGPEARQACIVNSRIADRTSRISRCFSRSARWLSFSTRACTDC